MALAVAALAGALPATAALDICGQDPDGFRVDQWTVGAGKAPQ